MIAAPGVSGQESAEAGADGSGGRAIQVGLVESMPVDRDGMRSGGYNDNSFYYSLLYSQPWLATPIPFACSWGRGR